MQQTSCLFVWFIINDDYTRIPSLPTHPCHFLHPFRGNVLYLVASYTIRGVMAPCLACCIQPPSWRPQLHVVRLSLARMPSASCRLSLKSLRLLTIPHHAVISVLLSDSMHYSMHASPFWQKMPNLPIINKFINLCVIAFSSHDMLLQHANLIHQVRQSLAVMQQTSCLFFGSSSMMILRESYRHHTPCTIRKPAYFHQ